MKIGVIGSGNIGSTVSRLLAETGHEVMIGTRRSPDDLAALVADMPGEVTAGSIADAARFGDVDVVAIPFGAIGELPADAFAGKVVADANNYYPGRDGHVPELDDDQTTSTEMLAEVLSGATVVKAFNTMNYRTLATAGEPHKPDAERLAVYIAGDDQGAKDKVAALVDEIGFAPVDTGSLAVGGRAQQPGSPIYAADMLEPDARKAVAELTG
jgi:predicted dinucleotide-binding enzyme